MVGESAVTYWRMGDDDIAEWHEEKGMNSLILLSFMNEKLLKLSKSCMES